MEEVVVGDGKYTLRHENGCVTVLRQGESWRRNLTGDKLVLCLVQEILKLKEELSDERRIALREIRDNLELYKEARRLREDLRLKGEGV